MANKPVSNYLNEHQSAQDTPAWLVHLALKCYFGEKYHHFDRVEDRDRQRAGIDLLARMSDGRSVPIELKSLKKDPLTTWGNQVPLETKSCVERNKPGFLLQGGKRTRFILFLFRDTGRFVILPFRALAAVFRRLVDTWRTTHDVRVQETEGIFEVYHSECVFVPVEEIRREISRYIAAKVS